MENIFAACVQVLLVLEESLGWEIPFVAFLQYSPYFRFLPPQPKIKCKQGRGDGSHSSKRYGIPLVQ